jgi:hypothetical protein
VKATGTRPKIIVSADGCGVVGHAGARLLADVAEATGLSSACSDALAGLRRRRRGIHDPGRIVVDLAVMLADGGQAISDLAVLRDQTALFGPVASDRPRGGCCPHWTVRCSAGSVRPVRRRGKSRGRNGWRSAGGAVLSPHPTLVRVWLTAWTSR